MNQEQYIEHEVKLRTHDALFNHIDYKFQTLEKKVDKLESRINWVVSLIVISIIIPIVLHHFHLT